VIVYFEYALDVWKIIEIAQMFGLLFSTVKIMGFFKGCPGWGANPGSFEFVYFSHSFTVPLSHSGSPGENNVTLLTKKRI
jgi:hypothetical protein